jgi:spermidine synthase
MSFGGVLGGLFCALIAPQIFDWTYEHMLLLVAAAALMELRNPVPGLASFWQRREGVVRVTIIGIAIVVLLSVLGLAPLGLQPSRSLTTAGQVAICAIAVLAVGNPLLFVACVAGLMLATGGWDRLAQSATPGQLTRSFFGIYTIGEGRDVRRLVHGTTTHGTQNLGSPEREKMPTTYYVQGSGVGQALLAAPRLFGPQARIDVVGLGAGTLACYARPGQRWTFYEIDPAIARIAADPSNFTFVQRCLPNPPVVIGDARLTLARAPAGSADVLVIDAFSSDAIPMHLMTSEAFDVYRRRLAPNGILLVHISNRYLHLEPVVAAAAARGRWAARMRDYSPSYEADQDGATRSVWIALSHSPQTLGRLVAADPAGWRPLQPRRGFAGWSDDHASLLPLIKR